MKLVAVFTTVPSHDMEWRSVEVYIYGRELLRRYETFHIDWIGATGVAITSRQRDTLEGTRQTIIDRTREKITAADRKTILTELNDIYRHKWDQSMIQEIDRYLLACYPRDYSRTNKCYHESHQ